MVALSWPRSMVLVGRAIPSIVIAGPDSMGIRTMDVRNKFSPHRHVLASEQVSLG
jgi:hypothetical protein